MEKMLGELLEKYTEEELSLFIEMMLEEFKIEECNEEKEDVRCSDEKAY